MYKTLKNLEKSIASKHQIEILSQKIDDNINMVEELKNDLVSMRNDNNEAKTCSKANRGSTGSSNLYSLSHSGCNVTQNIRFHSFIFVFRMAYGMGLLGKDRKILQDV